MAKKKQINFEQCYAEVHVSEKLMKWGFKKEWHYKLMIWYIYIKACVAYSKSIMD